MAIIYMYKSLLEAPGPGARDSADGHVSSPASAFVEVRELQHEVGLDMGIIFMYDMSIWDGSWGTGCC